MKILGWACATFVAAAIAIEIAMRLLGVLDFPLFSAGPPYGYIPRANQHGEFLNRNDWVFNERSMGIARPFAASDKADTVLIGDSIVSGGNPYRQVERLGPQLEGKIGGHVWPISANSWSLANELTYLRLNKDVASGADRIVFVLNSADFLQPSVWSNPITHPVRRPVSALHFVAMKKFTKITPTAKLAYPAKDDWSAFSDKNRAKLLVVAYPTKLEANDKAARNRQLIAPLTTVVGSTARIIDVGSDPRWSKASYRDEIHPDPATTAILAAIIKDAIAEPD